MTKNDIECQYEQLNDANNVNDVNDVNDVDDMCEELKQCYYAVLCMFIGLSVFVLVDFLIAVIIA
jgi:hypothetical protein